MVRRSSHRTVANPDPCCFCRAILHDSERFHDPDKFDPTRWLTPDGKLSDALPDAMSAFGYGRRACPGRHFAMASLFIYAASVLQVFDVRPKKDAHGTPKNIIPDMVSGVVTYVNQP